jgi:hypothetical protein
MTTTQKPVDLSKIKEFVDEANVFTRPLQDESDRGAALVGLAYLEELLARLIRAKMLDDGITKKLFEYPSALNTAHARLDLAHALGWIGPETYKDLDTVRKIRNKFAHAHQARNFQDKDIAQLCGNLLTPHACRIGLKPARVKKPRDQFLFAVMMLVLRLEFLHREAKAPSAGFDPPIGQFAAVSDGDNS